MRLKLLQSEGELTIASTGKDPATGKMVTQEYHVEGPVMIFLTTTAIDLDEELQNRCLTLAVDESAEQTGRIHRVQRERRTLAGLIAREERQGPAEKTAQRATAVAAGGRAQSVCAGADVRHGAHAQPARPRKISDAH